MEFFSHAKSEIAEYLEGVFGRKSEETAALAFHDMTVFPRLQDYVLGGKMIRGSLVMLASSMYGGTARADAAGTGAALELLQSSFLIHDDIMDRDALRRGKPSLHAQYALAGSHSYPDDSRHLGESLAICAGDICIFLAYEILSSLSCSADALSRLHSLISRELILVGLAQMEDVYLGADRGNHHDAAVSAEAVMNLYLYKTGRYSFSLPLIAGALLAGAAEEELGLLGRLGEQMGIIFQIKDDELGLYGSEERIGKQPGSDLKENKWTLYRCFLEDAADADQKDRLDAIFGNQHIRREDILSIQTLVQDLGVGERLERLLLRTAEQARQIITELRIGSEHREILVTLLEYNLRRQY